MICKTILVGDKIDSTHQEKLLLFENLGYSVLEMSLANWRNEMEHLGLDLRDGGRSLLDLRFADDTMLFGTNCHVIGVPLSKLVEKKIFCRGGITVECGENKSGNNAGPTTVAIADAEWIDHIMS